jgi:hypothetical protein
VAGYYDLLGVPRNASEMEIRSAYGRDVLRLNDSPPANAGQIRATLDEALATLVDPEKRSAYDTQLAALVQEMGADSADESHSAFKDARNGGLWFAGGGLVTAGTYAFSEGTYFLAWGPLLFGGFQLVRGLVRYLTVPSGARRAGQLMTLIGLIAVGVLSAGFVLMSETLGAQQVTERDRWNTMIDANAKLVDQASALVTGVFDRAGAWTDRDSNDMGQASALYTLIADNVSRTGPPRLVPRRTDEELPRRREHHRPVRQADAKLATERHRGSRSTVEGPARRSEAALRPLRQAGGRLPLSRA